jgi:hypothetical protein
MEAEKRGQAKKYRPCREFQFGHKRGDPLDLHILNSTRGHEVVHDIRDALLYWKHQWKTEREVTKNIEVIDIGMKNNLCFVRTYFELIFVQARILLSKRTVYSNLKLKTLAIQWLDSTTNYLQT